jgi:hypothetical protein
MADLAEADARAADARPQIAPERMRQRSGTPGRHRLLSEPWFVWTAGASVTALAFLVALWLTAPNQLAPGVATLIGETVSDATTLMAAVQTAGLRGTSDVKGAIEEINRLDDQRVTIKGWALDATASSSPLTVIVFAGGRHVLTATTIGARMDITRVLGLSNADATNASFENTFGCRPGAKLVVVAVTSDRRYSQFRSLACP